MNNRYEAAAIAVKQAEAALKTLKDFADKGFQIKGDTMLDQISNYIADVLADANYMCCGCVTRNLSLSTAIRKEHFVFYIKESCAIGGMGYPIFTISSKGEIEYHRNLEEWMMLTLIDEWENFKKELDITIKFTLKAHTESINKQIAHIAHVNEQLSKWHV